MVNMKEKDCSDRVDTNGFNSDSQTYANICEQQKNGTSNGCINHEGNNLIAVAKLNTFHRPIQKVAG